MNTKRHTPSHEKYYQEEFEDTKGVIRRCKTWTDRQHNGQEKDKRTNNNLQNIAHKTKDRVTRTTLKYVYA